MNSVNQKHKNNNYKSLTKIVNQTMLLVLFTITTLLLSCSNDDDNALINTHSNIEDVLTNVGFNGYAIVTKNGNDLVRQGFGLANVSTDMPQSYDLNYRIGSVTKTLTAAAIMQLKRDGLINNLNQTLNEFDDEFPNGNQITIAHLLSHQSGIPDYQFVVEDAHEQGANLDEEDIYDVIIEMIAQNGLNFAPGASKEYSNSNFLIAALLIQNLSQMSYHDYIEQNIFIPLSMTDTHKGSNSINTAAHAQGYNYGNVNSTYPMSIAFGVGDVSSSPRDMETWTHAVKDNWFTDAEKNEIFAQNVPSGFLDFGLGWFTTQEENTTMYWHGGDINGYWSMIGFVPEHDAIIVLLSNHQDDTGTQRSTIIQQLLTHELKSSI
ncbi:serine hydrolase domain-containing protein [Psychroserpens damuponensis]|uniref:serine hydrolase domain-containing protein n=1 Tax=Psychroserpens damuponensis TaxID=943936 RepID=UPI0006936142|nr:serine hydrolase domain-containing protein [Psychroserpens damuponensis]